MKRKLLTVLLVFCLLFSLSVSVYADMGPKPSVRVSFRDLPEGTVYGTLLSKYESYGPHHKPEWSWQNGYYSTRHGDDPIWQAFAAYQDADGYYFLQEWWDCTDHPLEWTYYAPEPFKVLLYFPETGEYLASGVHERYAYDSYYTAEVQDGGLVLYKNYQWGGELLGLLIRMALTIGLELLVALLFGYHDQDELLLFAKINVLTQLALNLALNLYAYFNGLFPWIFVPLYALLEMLVIAAETALYHHYLPRVTGEEQPHGKALGYAMMANILSFVLGVFLMRRMPWMF